jgi:hypothetical protein
MATRTASQKRFIVDRVQALAVVYLTLHGNLIVTEEPRDIGVDLWGALDLENKDGHRKFGVELRGVWTAVSADHAYEVLYPAIRRLNRYGPFAFPVVLFFFTMENNEGLYTWAAEPVVSATGGFEIVQHCDARCRPLNSDAIGEIVDAVDRWHDSLTTTSREIPDKHCEKSAISSLDLETYTI